MPAYTIKPLVTATAINSGGRSGHSETTDRSVNVNLSWSAKEKMGGPGCAWHHHAGAPVRGRVRCLLRRRC